MEVAKQEAPAAWKPDYSPCVLTGFISHDQCERIITSAETIGFGQSLVYGQDTLPTRLPDIRGSDSTVLNVADHRDLYDHLANAIQKLNNERYHFDIQGMEHLEVIRYRPGAFFKEHTDIGMEGAAHRKVSVILQLSDESDYEGGELDIGNYMIASRARGSCCIFPSWVPHEVKPVTSGLRYSLVCWAVGNFFR